jgi:hypothetical protein
MLRKRNLNLIKLTWEARILQLPFKHNSNLLIPIVQILEMPRISGQEAACIYNKRTVL